MEKNTTPKKGSPTTTEPWKIIVMVVGVSVAGLAAGYFGFSTLQKTGQSGNISTTNSAQQNVNTSTTNQNTNASITGSNANTNTNVRPEPVVKGRTTNGRITWSEPKKIASLDVLDTTGTAQYIVHDDIDDGKRDVAYYSLGTVKTGTYAGGTVVLVSAWSEGPSQYPTYLYLIKSGSKIFYLTQNSPAFGQNDGLNHAKLTEDPTYVLSDLQFPKEIIDPVSGFSISQVANQSYVNTFFDATNLKPVFTDETYGTVYTTKVFNQENSKALGASSNLFVAHGFYLKAPDGTTRVYEYVPPFVTTVDFKQVPDVTWSDGKRNSVAYNYSSVGGCGSYNYAAILDPSSISLARDLVQIGSLTNVGGLSAAVYGFKDNQHSILKKQYNDEYAVYGEGQSKVSYEKFIADRPVFVWVDPFGRLIKFSNANYQPITECGKPVIYLYPETTTNVDVQLSPMGGFSKSEPMYKNGWKVTARPNGQLTDLTTGLNYPYLFWEGRGSLYSAPDQGFVVAQADVHAFLVDSLTKLGLNNQELSDFIEFWEPRMQGSPYYVVGFFGNTMMDQLAPLSITPKPDTIIRILMDFRPVDAPVTIRPQRLTSIPRTGFTVIEWGGVIR